MTSSAKSSNPRPKDPCVTIWFRKRTRVRFPFPPPILKPQLLSVGFFLAQSRRFPRVVGGSCGSLRTSPATRIGRSGPHSTLSWPFLAPTSLPETGPKSAKAESQPHTDQGVTHGRIKRLDCSIGCQRGHTLAPASYRTCSLSETRIYFRT